MQYIIIIIITAIIYRIQEMIYYNLSLQYHTFPPLCSIVVRVLH